MKRILGTALLTAFILTPPANAEVIDLATVKCSELATMDNEAGTFLFTWLLGYQSGTAGTTTMDIGAMDQLGKSIGEYCGANPDVGILAASTEVMGQ